MKRLTILISLLVLLVIGFAVQPAAAQTGILWTGEFFNNGSQSGTPTYTRADSAINFNWGYGSPDFTIPADGFSARWTTSASFAAGTYRFSVLGDDGVRLSIDDVIYVDSLTQTRPGETTLVDVRLTAGTHRIRLDYVEISQTAYVTLSWTAQDVTTPPHSGSGAWTAQYFNNTSLTGTPALTVQEQSPVHDWGSGAPYAGLLADNFSVRWTTTQWYDAGIYEVSARADDGITVSVDGIARITAWGQSTGQTYTNSFTLAAGNHTIVVEYYEAQGLANLAFSFRRTDTTNPPPANTGAVATATAYRLNVRNRPDPVNGSVLLRVSRGDQYAVVGRNAESTWWQINVNGTVGWVNGRYLSLSNTQNVPVTSDSTSTNPTPTGYTITASDVVNVRSGPGTGYSRLAQLDKGDTAQIVGRNHSNTWWQITVSGITGWVSAEYAIIQWNADISRIPIVA